MIRRTLALAIVLWAFGFLWFAMALPQPAGAERTDAIVVPKAALSQGPQGQFVYAVNSEGKAEIRPVELGRETAEGWVVTSGLKEGDRVITEGIVKVRPGAPVTITPAQTGAMPK